ncbi:MAG: YwbE family protein [Halanaerobiales bacterium]|nr:YwbE family protein [Halanaerobiales bacterium]
MSLKNNLKKRDNIKVGQSVEIILQKNRAKIESGIIQEVLTNSPTHPHGILVKLNNGAIGRVKKINNERTKKREVETNELQQDAKETTDIEELLSIGEREYIEFKTSALWSVTLPSCKIEESNSFELNEYGRDASKVIIAETIASMLNTKGGHLLIGIKEVKNEDNYIITGIESEFGKIGDKSLDGYRRMLIDDIIRPYFPSFIYNHISDYIQIKFEEKDNHRICWLKIFKSGKGVFLNINNQDHFYIRTDAETRELIGRELVEYCGDNFK